MLTQIRPGTDGFYLRRANSKLCFLLHKILYAAKNASPEWGWHILRKIGRAHV